jgi:hypothetical protein
MAPSATSGTRPRPLTILAAAFLAGGAAAVGLNHFLDVHLSQRKPVVESEPIFVAMRPLPTGAPVTVWDVALRNWPKAMLPTTAMRVEDSFEGMKLKMPLREGQPLLSVQLEPLMGLAKTETMPLGTRENGELVVLDDRTTVQTRWPKMPARQPVATPHRDDAATSPAQEPSQIHQAAAQPVDNRLVIGPAASVAEMEKPTGSPAVPPSAQPTQMAGQSLLVPDPQTAPPLDDGTPSEPPKLLAGRETVTPEQPVLVLPVQGQPTVAATSPQPEKPLEVRGLPESDETIEAAVVSNPASVLAVAPQPAAVVARLPEPAVSPNLRPQRHLVVPERIAVMVDEVTTGSQAQDSARTPKTADSLRRLNSPLSTLEGTAEDARLSPAASSQPSSSARSAVTAQTSGMRPNPLRNPQQQATTPRQKAVASPANNPGPSRVVPRVDFPQREAVTPLSSGQQQSLQDRSSELAADEGEPGVRLFPRLSSRIEKAGEDWTRFRRSVFGESQQ